MTQYDQKNGGAQTAATESNGATWVALAAIIAATWFAYWPCLTGGFLWDDNTYIREATFLQSAHGLWQIWFEPLQTPQYHPLVFTSYWFEYQLWGLSTVGYHVVNVALHCVDTLLLWTILRRLHVPGAVLAAGLFALHPVHVESVAWIAERKDVLSALFYALTVLCWLRYLESNRLAPWLLALAFSGLTLSAKSVLCTLPVSLALLSWWKAAPAWRRWSLRLLPMVGFSIAFAALNIWREQLHGNPPLPYSILERVLLASRALWTHVAALVWPVGLTAVYEPWPVSTTDTLGWIALLASIAVGSVLLAGQRRFGRGPLVAAVFYALTLSPMLGLLDNNFMRFAFVADHFQYIASAALLALAAAVASQRSAAMPAEQRNALAAVGLGVLTALSWQQAGVYASAQSFWQDNIAKNPRSWTAYTNLAGALARDGKLQEALEQFRKAVEVKPDHAVAHARIGIMLDGLGDTEGGLRSLQEAQRLDPKREDTENNIGVMLMKLGRIEEAEPHFAAAVRLKPNYPEAWRHWGLAAAKLGKPDEAVLHLEQALRLRPDYPAARADLARLQAPQQ